MIHPHQEPLFNPLPTVVIGLAVVIIGVEALFSLGARGMIGGPDAVGWRLAAIRDYGFLDQVFDLMRERSVYPPDQLLRFLTYPLIHGSFTHAVFVCVFILAIGNMVGAVFRAWAVLVIFFISSAFGALVFGSIMQAEAPLIGGYPGVYGLIGTYTFLLWVNQVATGGPQYRAFLLIGLLLGIQLVFGVLFGLGEDWVADLAGFAAGYVLSFVISPGGWRRLLAKLRKR